jgi:hypothetical protein
MIIPVITGATGNYERFKEKFGNHTRKTLNKLNKKLLILEHHTLDGKYCSLKMEV